MKAKLLPRITEAMLYLLAAFVLFCAVTLYIPGSLLRSGCRPRRAARVPYNRCRICAVDSL